MRCNWCITQRTMNGSSSIRSLPSGSFLSDAFVVFSQKVGEGHFWRDQDRYIRPRTSWTVFLTGDVQCARVRKPLQSQKKRWQPPAPRCRGRETIALISCIVLLWFFFSLGFKFCCMVLRVANARALIIDLRRLCYWPRRRLCTSSSVLAGNNVFRFCH